MVNLAAIRDHVVFMLKSGLSGSLTYHKVDHTLDVTNQSLVIAIGEGITDKQILLDIQIAALYHDSGFLFVYDNHEEVGCELARKQLPDFGVSPQSLTFICALIMATKIPQSPQNIYQEIICDADLDYLGREDFFKIGNTLRMELIAYKKISNDHVWEERQLDFLQSHQYFTKTSRQKREPVKIEYIKQLLQKTNAETK